MSSGWVKVERDLLDSWLWEDAEICRVWLYLLLKANYEDKKQMIGGKLTTIKRGECFKSVRCISEQTGVSVKKVRASLEVLERANLITRKGQAMGQTFSLVGYGVEPLPGQAIGYTKDTHLGEPLGTPLGKQGSTYKEYIESRNKNEEENRINNSNSKAAFGRNRNVYLTTEEFEDLAEEFGYEAAMEKIETESAWKVKRGAEIDNDFALIRKWLLGDKERGLLEKPKPMVTEKPTEQLPEEEEEEEISDEEWLKL